MGLGVIREWSCLEHGEFEASHPICPFQPCDSKFVTREFRTAPTIGSRMVKQHHEGLKRTSDMMRIANFRTARDGEAAYGGDSQAKYGAKVLWGDESRKVLGRSFTELTGMAAQPLTVHRRDGSSDTLTRNSGMVEAVAAAGLTSRRVARPGELRVPRGTEVAPSGKLTSEGVAKSITE